MWLLREKVGFRTIRLCELSPFQDKGPCIEGSHAPTADGQSVLR